VLADGSPLAQIKRVAHIVEIENAAGVNPQQLAVNLTNAKCLKMLRV
jgi:hypothetical protein